MKTAAVVDLTRMEAGQSGVITEIHGGHGAVARIQHMGLRAGKRVKKVSSHFWHGPQTIEIGHMRFAVGYGMAKRIFLRVEEHGKKDTPRR